MGLISKNFNLGLIYHSLINKENIQKAKIAYNKASNADKIHIPYSERFEKKALQEMPEHSWMQNVKMTLVSKDIYKTLDDLFTELVDKSFLINKEHIGYFSNEQGMPVLAIDLETTGLSKAFQTVGGRLIPDTEIVGVCLATSPYNGYYIPVKHTEIDNVENYPYNEIVKLLTKIEKTFFTIYHHAQYDKEILELNGVETNEWYADTMIIGLHQNLKERFSSLGLKHLSKEILHREMIEIDQLMDSDFINFDRICAKMAYTYGCSDAVNTYGLFCVMTNFLTNEGEDFQDLPELDDVENPFLYQKIATKIDYKACDATRTMMRLGLPIDSEMAVKNLKTMIRRKIMLEKLIYEIMPEHIQLTSAEQLGQWIGETLYKHFKEYYKSKTDNEALMVEKFSAAIYENFNMERKVRKLKAGEKVTYNANANAFDGLMSNTENTEWLDKDTQIDIYNVAYYLSEYASVNHEIAILTVLVRFARNDDLGIARGIVDLKFSGADASGRWSNSSDGRKAKEKKLERVVFTGGREPAEYYPGTTQILGINAQGIPSTSYKSVKAKKLTKLPKAFIEYKRELDNQVDEVFTYLMETI